MALRLSCLAIGTALVLAVGFIDPTPKPILERQNLDTDLANARRPDGATASTAGTSSSWFRSLPEPASDVIATDYPLAAADIERLLETGKILIEHPEGGWLPVMLRDIRHRHGTRVLRILSDGLPGVITQRGEHLMGTLATRGATYSLSIHPSHGRQGATLIDQRQLDLRIIPNQQDFRHAPPVSPTVPNL